MGVKRTAIGTMTGAIVAAAALMSVGAAVSAAGNPAPTNGIPDFMGKGAGYDIPTAAKPDF